MVRAADAYIGEILELEELLRAVLHRFVPNPADLEDLIQETYIRLLGIKEADRVHIRSVRAFALTTARNVARDWVRHRRVIPFDAIDSLDALSDSYGTSGVDDVVNAHQELLRLAEAVAALPRRCGDVYTMRKVYGWSQKEIARHFGISVSSVKNHLSKAIRHCDEYLATSLRVPPTRGAPSWIKRWRGRISRSSR